MTAVHQLLGITSVVVSLTIVGAAVWSAVAARRSDGRVDHRFAVDRAVLVELFLVALAGLVGMAVLINGSHPADPLHVVYGLAAFICLPIAMVIGGRSPAGRRSRVQRDVWTAGGGLVLFGLGLRLIATG